MAGEGTAGISAAGWAARLDSVITLRRLGWLALAAAGITAGLITYGAWVRVSASGLGCPNWPLCTDSVFSGHQREALIESGHRLFAGLTMVWVAALGILGYRHRRQARGAAALLVGAFFLILFQAVLGGITVLTHLPGSVRLAHLATALTILGTLTWAGLLILSREWRPAPARLRVFPLVLLGASTVLLGGSIVATRTGFGCLDLPLCDGNATHTAAWLHGFHRVLGVVLLAGVAAAGLGMRRRGATPQMWFAWRALALLVLAQLIVGAAAISLTLPGSLRILHVGLATLIWWSLVGLWILALVSTRGMAGRLGR